MEKIATVTGTNGTLIVPHQPELVELFQPACHKAGSFDLGTDLGLCPVQTSHIAGSFDLSLVSIQEIQATASKNQDDDQTKISCSSSGSRRPGAR